LRIVELPAASKTDSGVGTCLGAPFLVEPERMRKSFAVVVGACDAGVVKDVSSTTA
jgi:hypothetical protein